MYLRSQRFSDWSTARMSSGQIKEVSRTSWALEGHRVPSVCSLHWQVGPERSSARWPVEHFMAFSVHANFSKPGASPLLICTWTSLIFCTARKVSVWGVLPIVYNIHSMLHLAADAKEFGCPDNCSAFPFENYLHHLKKLVRSGRSPLAQIVQKLNENGIIRRDLTEKADKVSFKHPNKAYMLNDRACCEVMSTTPEKDEGAQMFLWRVYDHLEPYISSPCDSRLCGACRTNIRNSRMKLISE